MSPRGPRPARGALDPSPHLLFRSGRPRLPDTRPAVLALPHSSGRRPLLSPGQRFPSAPPTGPLAPRRALCPAASPCVEGGWSPLSGGLSPLGYCVCGAEQRPREGGRGGRHCPTGSRGVLASRRGTVTRQVWTPGRRAAVPLPSSPRPLGPLGVTRTLAVRPSAPPTLPPRLPPSAPSTDATAQGRDTGQGPESTCRSAREDAGSEGLGPRAPLGSQRPATSHCLPFVPEIPVTAGAQSFLPVPLGWLRTGRGSLLDSGSAFSDVLATLQVACPCHLTRASHPLPPPGRSPWGHCLPCSP